MSGKNRQLITNEPVEFEKYPIEVGNLGELLIILDESIEYTSNQ